MYWHIHTWIEGSNTIITMYLYVHNSSVKWHLNTCKSPMILILFIFRHMLNVLHLRTWIIVYFFLFIYTFEHFFSKSWIFLEKLTLNFNLIVRGPSYFNAILIKTNNQNYSQCNNCYTTSWSFEIFDVKVSTFWWSPLFNTIKICIRIWGFTIWLYYHALQ